MMLDHNLQAFFALVKAGLWEQDVLLSQFGQIDFKEVYGLAEEQSVVGLVAAGIEHVVDIRVPQQVALTFAGGALQLEQRNLAMNDFVANLIEQFRKEDICALLVKGQGVAQCYERPLWRACGDIDLLLSDENYKRAKSLLLPLSDSHDKELVYFKHLALFINSWEIELHGTLRTRLSQNINNELDILETIPKDEDSCRIWKYKGVDILLPNVNEDILFIFTHIFDHFYEGGVGLRQICDLCRLLWCYNDEIKVDLLEKRLYRMKLIEEWKAFAAFSVLFLGIPKEMMPLFSDNKKWVTKAYKIMDFVMRVGNFGHNRHRDNKSNQSFFLRKVRSLGYRTIDCAQHFMIFPKSAISVWLYMIRTGLIVAFRSS